MEKKKTREEEYNLFPHPLLNRTEFLIYEKKFDCTRFDTHKLIQLYSSI